MSDIVVAIGEIIVGLALLTVLGAAVGVVVNRLTNKRSATEMLEERYIRGDMTREKYLQMRQDLAATSTSGEGLQTLQPNGREADIVAGAGKTK